MIYYIYKVRRKQTSIRFSRSVLTHRYISWISWNGHRPPRYPPSTSWVSTTSRSPRTRCFRGGAYTPRPAIAALLPLLTPGGQSKYPFDLSLRRRKTSSSPSLAHLSRVAPLVLLCPQQFARRQRPICGRSAAFCGLPINKKCGPAALRREPAQKSVDFSLKKNARRHAWLSRSCFGRNRRPAFTTALFPFSFFTKEKKKKTEANSAGSNTSLGLTSFVLTMYAIGPSRLVR